jgi:hypothetical protein
MDLELVSPVPAKESGLKNIGKCGQEQRIRKSASQNRERPSEIERSEFIGSRRLNRADKENRR